MKTLKSFLFLLMLSCCTLYAAAQNNCGVQAYFYENFNPNGVPSFHDTSMVAAGWHITGYQWSFGDGSTSTLQNPTHVYTAVGTFTVCEVVTAELPGTTATCSDTFCTTINPCSGAVHVNYTYTIHGDTIAFIGNSYSIYPPVSYQWGFGDNTNANAQNPTHIYSTPGTYHVCLESVDAHGCANYKCDTIVITNTACGNVQANFTIGNNGNGVVVLTSTSTNALNTATYQWWMDGVAITNPNPNTAYTINNVSSGYHTFCLFVYGNNSSVYCDSICKTEHVGSNTCNITAAFQYMVHTSWVSFYPATNTTSVYAYWSFGDGTNSTDTGWVTHTFPISSTTQTYHVCRHVYVAGTTCIDSFCQYVVVQGTVVCGTASFNSYTSGSSIHAYSTSTGVDSNSHYTWKITDANGNLILTQSGTTNYLVSPSLNNGTYHVCLYLSPPNATTFCDSTCQTVTVGTPCGTLTSAWTSVNLVNDSVRFVTADTNSVAHHNWVFGDGTYATGVFEVTHHYTSPGTYHVCLYVYIPGSSCVDSTCETVVVPNLNCPITSQWTSVVLGNDSVYFISADSNNTANHYWKFGDGTTGSGLSVVHHYTAPGTYHVCQYVYIPGTNCVDSTCETVVVSGNPCSGLSAQWTQTYNSNNSVHFVCANQNTAAHYYWSFGDGTTSTNADPTHYYTTAGLYNVCLYIYVPNTNCFDSSCHSIQANAANTCTGVAHIYATANPNGAGYLLEVSYTSGNITGYAWSNGATTSTITVLQGGYYCVTVSDANGCTAVACDTVGQNSVSCSASFTYYTVNCGTIHFANTSTGNNLSYSWSFGDGSSSNLQNPQHTFAAGTWTVELHITNTAIGCSETHYEVITVQPCGTAVICGVVFDDANGNGVQDSTEYGFTGGHVYISGGYSATVDSDGHYTLSVPAGTYNIYYCAPSGYTFTIPVGTQNNGGINGTCAYYSNVVVTGGTNCGYNFGIQNSSSTICGVVYYDANNNGVFDANSEAGIPNAEVHIVSTNGISYLAYTDQYGHYCIVVPAGSYVVTVSQNIYNSGVVTPQSISLTVSAGVNYYNNNFGVYTTSAACNLSVNITPHTTVTPGYPAYYDIQVCNVGANVTSGSVNMFYDPSLTFNYASPVQTSQNASTHTVAWSFTNLLPGSCQSFWVNFTADSNITVAQQIFTLAYVNSTSCNDVDMSNNVDTIHQEATASWDPNDKIVLPAGIGPQGLITNDQLLTYTINFQNTGNAPAVNVVLHDIISDNLDLNTFKMLSASHPYTMQFSGREAIWKFNAIMLPDSNTDEQHSHGFVSFTISPVQGLAQGTTINNTADIYFDYNSGVRTNTTLNTVDQTLSVNDIEKGTATITLLPNPFNQFTTIKIDGADAPFELKVYDLPGKLIKNETAYKNTISIERGNMAAGMYLYEITKAGKLIGKGKMIAE